MIQVKSDRTEKNEQSLNPPGSRRVRDLLTSEVFSVKESASLYSTGQLMERMGISHVPVVSEGNKLEGMVTYQQLLRQVWERLENSGDFDIDQLKRMPIGEFMSRSFIATTPEAPLSEVADILLDSKQTGVPVTEKSKLVGMITSSDLISLLADVSPKSGKNSGQSVLDK